jgi:hypothetical protein
MSGIVFVKRWPMASLLFGIHALLVLTIYVLWLNNSDPPGEREMIWLLMWFVDFPIFFAYARLVNHASGLMTAIICIGIGGAEWIALGILIDLLRKTYVRKQVLRGTQNI